MRKLWLAGIVTLGALAPRAEAEVVGTDPGNQDTSTPPATATNAVISGYNNVGQVDGASGVYLGNGWVLTADHVGAGTFVLNGGTYTAVSGSATRLSSPDTYGTASPVGADLLLFRVNGASSLPGLTLASSEIANGQEIFSVGFGLSRPADETPTTYYISGSGSNTTWSTTYSDTATGSDGAYAESGGGVRMWGNNYVTTYNSTSGEIGNMGDPVVNTFSVNGPIQGFVTQFYQNTPYDTEEQQIAVGDSGGGVFNDSDQLVGINDATLNLDGQPGNTAAYADGSEYADLFQYENQIEAITGVPEPAYASLSVLSLGALAMKRRRCAV
jgi:hypothetical protein